MSQIDLPRRHHLDAIESERWTASDQNRWTPPVRYAWTASLEIRTLTSGLSDQRSRHRSRPRVPAGMPTTPASMKAPIRTRGREIRNSGLSLRTGPSPTRTIVSLLRLPDCCCVDVVPVGLEMSRCHLGWFHPLLGHHSSETAEIVAFAPGARRQQFAPGGRARRIDAGWPWGKADMAGRRTVLGRVGRPGALSNVGSPLGALLLG